MVENWRVRKYLHTLERLGQVVREERIELGLSVEELATAAQVSVEFVERVEAGHADPDYVSVRRILRMLGIEPFAIPHALLVGA